MGIRILDSTSSLTPYAGIDFAEESKNKNLIRILAQLELELKLELTETQELSSENFIDPKIQLDGTINWQVNVFKN